MIRIINADGVSEYKYLDGLRARADGTDEEIVKAVKAILDDVRQNGDRALNYYGKKFDGAENVNKFTQKDFKKAYDNSPEDLIKALNEAARRIKSFHKKQIKNGFCIDKNGCRLGQIIRGLRRVGIYVPGGTAAYPSSVLMCAIPAKLAGVEEVMMISPPSKDGGVNNDILAAAYIAGADTMYSVGGAHGIAALAYGTESIERVDKIVGPGNAYVATAKRMIYGVCDIDMIAGPSEIMIMADDTANPVYAAADLISQAEHDKMASSVLITDSIKLAADVQKELEIQLDTLPRSAIARESVEKYGGIIIVNGTKEMLDLVNYTAPEHLEILTADPEKHLSGIKNAGSVFLGSYSPEPLGDYLAGTNHVLPTGGTARFFSPLSVDSFVKKIQYISYTEEGLKEAAKDIICLAEREGLAGHANSVKVRVK